ncbi:MAG: YbhB/YbcL family Raf kinase inhibitor-like protein [Alphaproteobacteria bacterium]|nr:YbhB/YbcL family Raf kinase inhibitor-like protein [Alphaproteobacteria bacterium]
MRTGLIVAFAAVMAFAVTANANFTVKSPTLSNGGVIPNKHVFNGYGYNGDNVSPALSWSEAPAGTKSFAITVYDPDAPHPGGWWHWLVFDIPAQVIGLAENAASGVGLPPSAVQSVTDFRTTGYGGPCPPPGKPHHYVFTVYALKVARLDAKPTDPPAKVDNEIRRQSLAHASIVASFGK